MGKIPKSAAITPEEIKAAVKDTRRQVRNHSRNEKRRRKKALSAREAQYVGERLKPGVGRVKAARAAGFARVPTRPAVELAIQAGIKKQMKDYALTAEDVLLEIRRIALVDPRDMFDEANRLLPIRSMDEDTRRAITSIEIKTTCSTTRGGDETVIEINKVRYPKEKALEMLAKHFNVLAGGGDAKQRDRLNEIVAAFQEGGSGEAPPDTD